MKVVIRRICFFLLFFVIWEAIYQLNIIYEFRSVMMFPSPVLALKQLYIGLFETGMLKAATMTSMVRIMKGFTLAIVLGTLLGVLLGRSKLADETLGSLVVALQTIPSIVWLPIALITFSNENHGILFVVTLGGMWALTMNMRQGVQNVEPQLLRAAATMGYKGAELVWKVILPASIPSFLTGARLAWAFGWRALMAAELIGRGGLGRTLMDAKDYFNPHIIISIMIIISVIGLIVEYAIFQKIEKRVLSTWGLAKK